MELLWLRLVLMVLERFIWSMMLLFAFSAGGLPVVVGLGFEDIDCTMRREAQGRGGGGVSADNRCMYGVSM